MAGSEKNQATPRQMLKLVIYAAMNRIYSSRDIRKACKRAITKNQARLYTKLTSFVAECEELYGVRTVYHDQISIHTLKRLKKQLCRVKVQEGIVFVHGIGRRKTQLQKSLERITSEYGTMLRMNRSIQAEGSFADVKEDMNFRRYLYRGKANALAESILLAMGRNINKLHCKIQTGRTGSHLFSLKTA